jgi:CubicO group peptidase (beta-lactamase class C family)
MVLAGLGATLAAPRHGSAATGYGSALDRARALDQLNAIVVSADGQIIEAESFRGPGLDRAVNVKSVSKTIVAALTGIAIDQGALPGPGATLAGVAPDLIPAAADPRVGDITVADLLTMQAGLERTSGRNYGAWVQSRDWVAYALSRPMVGAPGQGMLYSTGSYHVLGAVLAEVTGQSLLDLAREGLGRPLGIEIPPWTRDPQGRFMGGNEMALSPLALIRFGEAFRQGGTLDGAQVVSPDWVRQSFTPRTRSVFSGHDYGYGWFLLRAGRHDVAYARGYGGQMLYVVPSLGLTVAITSDPTRPARSEGHAGDLNALLTDLIVPAAEAARG